MRRWPFKSALKAGRLTIRGGLILEGLDQVAVSGTGRVAVKCIDMTQNSDCEGRRLRLD